MFYTSEKGIEWPLNFSPPKTLSKVNINYQFIPIQIYFTSRFMCFSNAILNISPAVGFIAPAPL